MSTQVPKKRQTTTANRAKLRSRNLAEDALNNIVMHMSDNQEFCPPIDSHDERLTATPIDPKTLNELCRLKAVCRCLRDTVRIELKSDKWAYLNIGNTFVKSKLNTILWSSTFAEAGYPHDSSHEYEHGGLNCDITREQIHEQSTVLCMMKDYGHVEVIGGILGQFEVYLKVLNKSLKSGTPGNKICTHICYDNRLYNSVKIVVQYILRLMKSKPVPAHIGRSCYMHALKSGIQIMESMKMFYRKYVLNPDGSHAPSPPGDEWNHMKFLINYAVRGLNEEVRTPETDQSMLAIIGRMRRHVSPDQFPAFIRSSIEEDAPNILQVMGEVIMKTQQSHLIRDITTTMDAKSIAFQIIRAFISRDHPNGFRAMLQDPHDPFVISSLCKFMVKTLCHLLKICANSYYTAEIFDGSLDLLSQITVDIHTIQGTQTDMYTDETLDAIIKATAPGLEPTASENGVCMMIQAVFKYLKHTLKYKPCDQTQLRIIQVVMNVMQKIYTQPQDIETGIDILSQIYCISTDTTKRSMAQSCIVQNIHAQNESVMRVVFRHAQTEVRFNQTAHTYLVNMIHIITSLDTGLSILQIPPANTHMTAIRTQPILHELCRILHIHRTELLLQTRQGAVMPHKTLHIPTILIFHSIARVFSPDQCSASQQWMASNPIYLDAVPPTHNDIQIITPINLIHDVLCLESHSFSASLPDVSVVIDACRFLIYAMIAIRDGSRVSNRGLRETSLGFFLHVKNCAAISPACIDRAISEIEHHNIDENGVSSALFEHLRLYVTGS